MDSTSHLIRHHQRRLRQKSTGRARGPRVLHRHPETRRRVRRLWDRSRSSICSCPRPVHQPNQRLLIQPPARFGGTGLGAVSTSNAPAPRPSGPPSSSRQNSSTLNGPSSSQPYPVASRPAPPPPTQPQQPRHAPVSQFYILSRSQISTDKAFS
jgi:hypothetical protein